MIPRLDIVIKLFEKLIPQDQRVLGMLVQQAGGPDAALKQPDVVQDLLEREKAIETSYTVGSASTPGIGMTLQRPLMGTASRWAYEYPRAVESRRTRAQRSVDPLNPHPHSRPQGSSGLYGGVPTPGTFGRFATPELLGIRPPPREPALSTYPFSDPVRASRRPAHTAGMEAGELSRLQKELAEDPVVEVKRNLETFERKFEILQREGLKEMRDFVKHEGDRVINSVLTGPHERIIDPVRLLDILEDIDVQIDVPSRR